MEEVPAPDFTPDPVPAPSSKRPAAVSHYVWALRIYGVIYAAVGALFFFFPVYVLSALNLVPDHLHFGTAIPESSERFWLVLAVSMMAMLTALAFLGAEQPRTRGYSLVHILSKLVSSAGFFYMYRHHAPYLAYLLGIAADLPIAVVVTLLMLRAGAAYRKLDREGAVS